MTSDDAAAFQSLRLQGLLECPDAFSSSHAEEVALPLASVAARLSSQPHGAVLGYFIDGDLAGMVGAQREHQAKLAHKAIMWGLYVAPPHRRRGVARTLIDAVLRHAVAEWGVMRVNLGVNTKNRAALALYESMGFRIYGTEREFLQVDGVLHDEHLMTWSAPGVPAAGIETGSEVTDNVACGGKPHE